MGQASTGATDDEAHREGGLLETLVGGRASASASVRDHFGSFASKKALSLIRFFSSRLNEGDS